MLRPYKKGTFTDICVLKMSAILKLNLQHVLPNEFEIVYEALFDLKKFGELHPYMTEVKIMENRSPEYIEYEITEEIFFLGFIKNKPHYTAKVMEPEKHKKIRYTSAVKKNIFLTIDLSFSVNKNGMLVVNEEIELRSNKIIGFLFLNILQKAHLRFFKNLRSLLSNSIEDVKTTS